MNGYTSLSLAGTTVRWSIQALGIDCGRIPSDSGARSNITADG